LKLATLPSRHNPAALIFRLAIARKFDCWISPPILEEYSDVLAADPEVLADVHEHFEICYPLTTLDCISHEPDNRFIECALAVGADYLVTVNVARGHFDQPRYGTTRVITPGVFINLPKVAAWIESTL
jgi:predicted nucleic acid-binding protein